MEFLVMRTMLVQVGYCESGFHSENKEHDTTEKDQASPLFIMNNFYFKPPFRAKREKDLLLSLLLIKTGEKAYPGDFVPSPNWPFTAPGKFGPLNAMSPKYFNASSIVDCQLNHHTVDPRISRYCGS